MCQPCGTLIEFLQIVLQICNYTLFANSLNIHRKPFDKNTFSERLRSCSFPVKTCNFYLPWSAEKPFPAFIPAVFEIYSNDHFEEVNIIANNLNSSKLFLIAYFCILKWLSVIQPEVNLCTLFNLIISMSYNKWFYRLAWRISRGLLLGNFNLSCSCLVGIA